MIKLLLLLFSLLLLSRPDAEKLIAKRRDAAELFLAKYLEIGENIEATFTRQWTLNFRPIEKFDRTIRSYETVEYFRSINREMSNLF